jgi:hypothetical protein
MQQFYGIRDVRLFCFILKSVCALSLVILSFVIVVVRAYFLAFKQVSPRSAICDPTMYSDLIE